ncbi:carbamoyltransferase N-terminal domain-containing protein [Streptomyces galilaeus]|uniref:carbamoyltransferase N-terminal domain-containing protein n=1 Tax=Streptomyces galilaeus TaxID=33899 RepID=UPI0038F5D5B9
MRVLGINALFHDPAAALVMDGRIVAATEEERFSRRKHGKRPVPFSAWELPELSARWCLEQAGLAPSELDAVAYSYDPDLARPADRLGLNDPWDHLRQEYARRAPEFLAEALPGLDPAKVRFVHHHVAHAASAGQASPYPDCAVLVLDGRGECGSHLAGRYANRELTVLGSQSLPDSMGLFYEDLTQHLGFLRSSDEFKVMALASYGTPRFLDRLRELPERPPVIVTDNASGDGTAAAVRRGFPEVLLLEPGTNLGAVGRNLAVRHVRTPYVAFCDDDTWWEPGSLRRAADLLDAGRRLAAVTARIVVEPDGGEDLVVKELRESPLTGPDDLPGPALGSFLAAATVLRVDAFRAAGGFHPGLWLGGEEELLATDLLRQGWWLNYAEELTVHHQASLLRDSGAQDPRAAQHAVVHLAAPPAAVGAAAYGPSGAHGPPGRGLGPRVRARGGRTALGAAAALARTAGDRTPDRPAGTRPALVARTSVRRMRVRPRLRGHGGRGRCIRSAALGMVDVFGQDAAGW